jgi:hypothetical protein
MLTASMHPAQVLSACNFAGKPVIVARVVRPPSLHGCPLLPVAGFISVTLRLDVDDHIIAETTTGILAG